LKIWGYKIVISSTAGHPSIACCKIRLPCTYPLSCMACSIHRMPFHRRVPMQRTLIPATCHIQPSLPTLSSHVAVPPLPQERVRKKFSLLPRLLLTPAPNMTEWWSTPSFVSNARVSLFFPFLSVPPSLSTTTPLPHSKRETEVSYATPLSLGLGKMGGFHCPHPQTCERDGILVTLAIAQDLVSFLFISPFSLLNDLPLLHHCEYDHDIDHNHNHSLPHPNARQQGLPSST
jgi:hypothetical protein